MIRRLCESVFLTAALTLDVLCLINLEPLATTVIVIAGAVTLAVAITTVVAGISTLAFIATTRRQGRS